MKRKMIAVSTAYLSGLFFASFFTKASDLITVAGIFALLVLIGRKKGMDSTDFSVTALSFSLAFAVFTVYTGSVCRKITAFDGTSGSFSGVVSEIKDYDNDKSSYVLKGKINGVQKAKVSLFTGTLDVEYGDTVQMDCKFSVFKKDYLFDSEGYYKSYGIFLSADGADNIVCTRLHRQKLKNFLMNYRERIISDFRIKLGNDCGSFLSGMVFGDKSYIDGNTKNSLYRSGIGHVLAMSGLHVSVVASAFMFFMRKLRVNRYISFLLMDTAVVIMIVMAKSPVSAVRAGIMLNMIYSARLFRRESDTFNSLAIAVLIICTANPYAIYSAGFIMSVTGTFGIGVLAPYMTKNIPDDKFLLKLAKSFLSLMCTAVAVMPVSLMYFDETSIISPLVNIIFVPLCSVAMIIGMIYVLTGGILPLLGFAGILIKAVIFCTEKIGSIKWAYFSCGGDIAVKSALLCTLAVVLVKLFFNDRKYIVLSLVLSFSSVLVTSAVYRNTKYKSLNIALLGSNSRSAVVISCQGNTVIADLNGNYRTSSYVEKYLKRNGINSADILVLSDKVQSKYPVYRDIVRTEKLLVSGSTPVCSDVNTVFDVQNGWTATADNFSASFSDGVLTVLYGNSVINFTDKAESLDGITIHYGRLKKSDQIICDGKNIYTDSKEDIIYKYSGMENFEICGNRIKKL